MRLEPTPRGTRLAPTPRAPRLGRSQLVLAFYGLLTGLAVLWAALRGQPNFLLRQPYAHPAAHLLSSSAIGAALGLLLVLATRLSQERFAWARALHNEFRHLLGALSHREILLLAAASAIGEECFFRGALLSQLGALLPGTAGLCLGVLGSALLFGMLHIGPGSQFLPWTLLSFGVGLILGLLYVGTGDLFGPIAAHFTINLLNLQDIVRRQLPA